MIPPPVFRLQEPMRYFLAVQFAGQKWGIDIAYIVQAILLPRGSSGKESLPEYLCVRNRAVPLIVPSSLVGMITYDPAPAAATHAVVISRGNLWLALAVSRVLGVQEIEISHASWIDTYIPIGMRRDLVFGVGTNSDGDPLILIHSERLISAWQEQSGEEAFPLPSGLRLGEKILANQEKPNDTGQERRSHLRLERTEWTLIQKSKQSGYPAYRAIISFQKSLDEDSVQLPRVVKLLQQSGTVVGAEAIYKPQILGKFGRHLGFFYLTSQPPETILNRLHELQEVEKAELVSFRD